MYNCVSLLISNKQRQQAEARVARLANGARAERLKDERERDLRMGRQWRQHVNETARCHWAHQSGQPSGKSKASAICFTFPLFSHLSLSLCPPALKTGSLFIPSPGFKCHLVLSTWMMWNFSRHSFGADFWFIFWPVRFRWTFECPCKKRWLYVCIFRTEFSLFKDSLFKKHCRWDTDGKVP